MKRGKTAIAFPVIPPFLVAAYSVTSRGTMLFLRPLPPPAEPGALWMQGRGDNSGNMVLLSLASPLGEEGHEVAKGCWRVRIGKKLKVEQAAYRRSRPRWSVTSALGPVHPMAPQGATRVGGEKSLSHTLPAPFRRFPLWWLRHHLSPYSGGTMDAGLLSQFVFMAITAENHTTALTGEARF